MDDQNQKFQPPSSNIFIRSMQDDLNTLKNSGGQMPNISGQPVEVPLSPQPVAPQSQSAPSPAPSIPSSVGPAFNQPAPTPVVGFDNAGFPPTEPPLFASEGMVSPPAFSETPEKAPRRVSKKLVLIIVVFILLIGIGALGYFVIYPKYFKPPVTPIVTTTKYICSSEYQCVQSLQGSYATLEDCQISCKVVTPTSTASTIPLLPVQQAYRAQNLPINLGANCTSIMSAIKTEAKQSAQVDVFKILIPKIRTEYLTIQEIASDFVPKLPVEASSSLKEKYLAFAYYGETNTSLGLALELKHENIEALKSYLLTWEKKTMANDLSNFFLVAPTTKPKSLTTFKQRDFLGAYVRYLTYPKPQVVLSYALFNDYLIITTSNEAMDSALQHLQAGGILPVIQ